MSLEKTPADDVETLASELGEAIAALPEYQDYEAARTAVAESEDLQEEISEFERIREEFRLAQQRGEATESDLTRVTEAQEQLHSRPAMAEYLDAQAALRERLETLNRAISEPLEVDFGGEAGGCCND